MLFCGASCQVWVALFRDCCNLLLSAGWSCTAAPWAGGRNSLSPHSVGGAGRCLGRLGTTFALAGLVHPLPLVVATPGSTLLALAWQYRVCVTDVIINWSVGCQCRKEIVAGHELAGWGDPRPWWSQPTTLPWVVVFGGIMGGGRNLLSPHSVGGAGLCPCRLGTTVALGRPDLLLWAGGSFLRWVLVGGRITRQPPCLADRVPCCRGICRFGTTVLLGCTTFHSALAAPIVDDSSDPQHIWSRD